MTPGHGFPRVVGTPTKKRFVVGGWEGGDLTLLTQIDSKREVVVCQCLPSGSKKSYGLTDHEGFS